jgi:hypothetical protein
MTTYEKMRHRVAGGIRWLDENRPGWLDRINLATLDLEAPCRCILGQEWLDEHPETDPILAFEEAFEAWNSWNGDPDWDVELGFELHRPNGEDYAELTNIWRSEILRLRAERAL